MALITTLATLKTAISDTLNRADISTASGGTMEVHIQLAEQRFQRDPRIREPGSNNSVLPSLMTTDPNWLLTAHPDIYLYGTLVELAPYLKDDARVPVWEQRYQDAVATLSGSVRLDPNRTALALTSYAELQLAVADALNRGDIKNIVPVMVALAEAGLRNDGRVRNLTNAAFSVDADDEALPAGLKVLESVAHNGPTYYGPIEKVGADMIGTLKGLYGESGVPAYCADVGGSLRFAPVPDTTYSLKITYWQTITALASGANWLYTNHPHIYFFATLAQAGPWVKGDVNAMGVVADAQGQLEDAIAKLDNEVWDRQWGGTLRRQFSPIG